MSLSLCHPRTGLWLTRKPEFQTWLQRPDSALWLSGIPGAGKTVLAATLIEEALKRCSEKVATVFFFCDYKNVRTQTAENVLSALASQLAIQKEEAYGYLERYYQELNPSRGLERRPHISGLRKVLEDMVKAFDQVYLIVDGLDECGDNTNNVIDGILSILECSDNISAALLSRDEYNIRDRLEEDFTGVEIAAHTDDISEYVTSEIEKRISNKSLRIDDLNLKGEILERLIDGARGMFRWVACQLDFLGDCLSDKECREALSQLPPGLDESYSRILQRVPSGKERIVQMILNFIAYAEPQMDIPLLREALSVPEIVGKDVTLDPNSIIREGSITKLCRSFIRKSNDGCQYEFAHFSVQEFLQSEMMSTPGFEIFKVSKSICQMLLAKQCLKYLVLLDFSHLPTEKQELYGHLKMRLERYPFYFYAATLWPIFAKAHWADEGLIELAEVLFQPQKTGNFISWALELASFIKYQQEKNVPFNTIRHPDLDGKYIRHALDLLPRLVDKKFTALHMAAALSLPIICSSLIGQGAGINQWSSFGSPLQCAVQGLLLAFDCLSDNHDPPYLFPYDRYSYWETENGVSEFGMENTIRVLLNLGAKRVTVCSGPFEGQTLVTVALRLGFHTQDLCAAAILLEAGYGLEEHNLKQFTSWRKHFQTRLYSPDKYHVESLILSLSPVIDTSAAHFHLCQAAWSLAIEMGWEFAQDPYLVDTRISLSQDTLSKRILTSARNSDTKPLIEALKDPRVDLRGLCGDNGMTVFETWLTNIKNVNLWEVLSVIRVLLSAGMEVKQPSERGLMPFHQLASRFIDDWALRDDDEALCEIVREFIRKGTGCDARTQGGQNVFHLGLRSPTFIKAVLNTETEKDIQTALRTHDEQGYTPITFALQAGEEEVALLLLERTNCNHETLSGPTSVYAHCVTGGANRAFNILLDTGVEVELTGAGNKTLLHYVGPKTGEKFVLQLIRMFPDGLRCRIDAKIPLDTYFESCIIFQQPLDSNVVRLLAGGGSHKFDQGDSHVSHGDLILCIQNLRHLRNANPEWPIGMKNDVFSKAIDSLLQLGSFEPDEAGAQVKWMFQLLKPLQRNLADLWPVSSEAIRDVLEHTAVSSWEPLRGSAAILRLLSAAVKFYDVDLVELLLKNGVSVHQRIYEMSALEMACQQVAESRDMMRLFRILLDHADSSRLNEINPYRGQEKGLIHYLVGRERQGRLQELLKRGVDVNLRTNVRSQPAIVQHLFDGTSESAIDLLEGGADPTASDALGQDAALAAAYRGNMDMLLRLHVAEGRDWQIDWRKTATATLSLDNDRQITVSQANALHWAAVRGHCDILGFYLDRGLLTDVNTTSVELLTPMHLAASGGHFATMKLVHSRGGKLNLKAADGSLPLHLAVRNEHPELVEFLVENGSAMDADKYGLTPVGYAMQLQNQSILDCLCATKQYLDYQSQPRRREQELVYAYEQALIRGDVEECERLRGQGCPVNVDLPGQHGRSALLLAIEDSKMELFKWLLDHGAQIAKEELREDGEVTSPLPAIIMQPSLNDMLLFLLQKYEDEGGSIASEKPGLICIAVQYDNTSGLEMLLNHVARNQHTKSTDRPNGPDFDDSPLIEHRLNGEAPLHVAAKRGNCEAIKLLVDHGANVNAVNDEQKTPLQLAIEHEPRTKSPAARLLLHHGAALELRNEWGQTAVLHASQHGRTELVQLLHEAGADLEAADFEQWTCLHFAADYNNLGLFVWLVGRGLQLHAKNSLGPSAIHYASFRTAFSSFLLSLGSAFDNSEAMTYATTGRLMNLGPAWLNEHFNMYLRRLGPDRLRTWANLEPTDSWSPLCMLASIGRTLAVTNILRLGADVDFEGSPSGSALMVACAAGRLDAVKILVRHGASISYPGTNGIRSALDAARNFQAIVAWLLVDRFIEQRKISDPAGISSSAHTTHFVKGRSEIVKAALIITGTDERQVHESARDYWNRLMAVKKGWRGRIVRQDERVQTHRPSRLDPVESVRICPGDYGVPKEQN